MAYHLDFTDKANIDIASYKKTGNKVVLNKLLKLLEELSEHLITSTGKPEPLKHSLTGSWSRRINQEHRLVYEVSDATVSILSAKGHY
jgi:toxin YoeB